MPYYKDVETLKKEFIEKAKAAHGDDFNYSEIIYKTSKIMVENIDCVKHGKFKQHALHHIKSPTGGCKLCEKEVGKVSLKYTNEEIDQYLIDNNRNIIRLGDYKGVRIPLDFQCLVCSHVWDTSFGVINSNKSGCPMCNRNQHTNEKTDKLLIENNTKIKRIGDVNNSYDKVDWQCLECNNIWKTTPVAILCKRRTGCPLCATGKNQRIVENFLLDNNFNIEKISIKLPINVRHSLPDFYIPSLNLIIEYNGAQHYILTKFGSQTTEEAEQRLKYQQTRDQQLREYCVENSINLLEINGIKYKNESLVNFLYNYFKISKAA
jgi:predicted  nucleic acid-binding Zn-ribbon protein